MGDVKTKSPEISTLMQRNTFESRTTPSKTGSIGVTRDAARTGFRSAKMSDSIFAGDLMSGQIQIEPQTTGKHGGLGNHPLTNKPQTTQEQEGQKQSAQQSLPPFPGTVNRVPVDANLTFTYVDHGEQSGPPPNTSAFGLVQPILGFNNWQNLQFDSSKNIWELKSDVLLELYWWVCDSIGPFGQIDIQDENDKDITASNWQSVVADLTPNTNDLGGRPPRTQFWSEHLTRQHEKYHIDQQFIPNAQGGYGFDATAAMQASANTFVLPTLSNPATQQEINTFRLEQQQLALQVTNVGLTEMARLINQSSTEINAYASQIPDYQALTNDISSKAQSNNGY